MEINTLIDLAIRYAPKSATPIAEGLEQIMEGMAKEREASLEQVQNALDKSELWRVRNIIDELETKQDGLSELRATAKGLKSIDVVQRSTNGSLHNGLVTGIDELGLSVRSYNCLMRAGIKTVEELIRWAPADLMRVRNLGRKDLDEILAKLGKFGLELAPSKEGGGT